MLLAQLPHATLWNFWLQYYVMEDGEIHLVCPRATDTGPHRHREAGGEAEPCVQEGGGQDSARGWMEVRNLHQANGAALCSWGGKKKGSPALQEGAWTLPGLVASSALTSSSGRCWEGWLALYSPFSLLKV